MHAIGTGKSASFRRQSIPSNHKIPKYFFYHFSVSSSVIRHTIKHKKSWTQLSYACSSLHIESGNFSAFELFKVRKHILCKSNLHIQQNHFLCLVVCLACKESHRRRKKRQGKIGNWKLGVGEGGYEQAIRSKRNSTVRAAQCRFVLARPNCVRQRKRPWHRCKQSERLLLALHMNCQKTSAAYTSLALYKTSFPLLPCCIQSPFLRRSSSHNMALRLLYSQLLFSHSPCPELKSRDLELYELNWRTARRKTLWSWQSAEKNRKIAGKTNTRSHLTFPFFFSPRKASHTQSSTNRNNPGTSHNYLSPGIKHTRIGQVSLLHQLCSGIEIRFQNVRRLAFLASTVLFRHPNPFQYEWEDQYFLAPNFHTKSLRHMTK